MRTNHETAINLCNNVSADARGPLRWAESITVSIRFSTAHHNKFRECRSVGHNNSGSWDQLKKPKVIRTSQTYLLKGKSKSMTAAADDRGLQHPVRIGDSKPRLPSCLFFGKFMKTAVKLGSFHKYKPPNAAVCPFACSPLLFCVVWQLDKLFTCQELPALSTSKNQQT